MANSNTNLTTLVVTSIIIVIIICLTIPNILLPYIKHKQSHPQKGIENLNFGDKFMNLMYFMSKAPLLTCLVVVVLLTISIILGSLIKIRPSTIKSIRN